MDAQGFAQCSTSQNTLARWHLTRMESATIEAAGKSVALFPSDADSLLS